MISLASLYVGVTTTGTRQMGDHDAVCFRHAVEGDVASLLEMIQLNGAQHAGEAKLNAADLLHDGFRKKCCFKVLLAELKSPPPSASNTRTVGYVLYYYTYSTWEGRVMFIEDLFVRDDYQNGGYETALVKEVAKVAVDRNCCRIITIVQEDNSKTRKLLDRLGGETLHTWLTVWLRKPDLQHFADQPVTAVSDVTFRQARESDTSSLLSLVQLMATDMKAPPNGVKIGEKEILRDGFGEDCLFKVLLVELASPPNGLSPASQSSEPNKDLIGYAFYYFTYSSQQGRVIYLEDVFIKAEFRNKGYGTILIREVAKIGQAEGCSRMMWQVLDWNTKAIRLYKRVGGTIMPGLLTVKIPRPNFHELAS